MKIGLRVVTRFECPEHDIVTGMYFFPEEASRYVNSALHLGAKSANIHIVRELSNDEFSITYYRDFAIFHFKGIKDYFIFDTRGDIPLFDGVCRMRHMFYTYIDTCIDFNVKNHELLN